MVSKTIAQETRQLRDAIFAEARARGVELEEESLAVDLSLPVLRVRVGERVLRSVRVRLPGLRESSGCDVISVMGSGFRSSRMWPRNANGWFKLGAIVDHLLALVREELRTERCVPKISVGVPATASGLHVIHAAAQVLGRIGPDVTPETLVERVEEPKVRRRIETHLAKGLTDADLRVLGKAAGVFVSRDMNVERPFTPINNETITMLRFGERRDGDNVARRVVLLLDRRGDRITIADPSGEGIVRMKIEDAEATHAVGATYGRVWVGTASHRSWRDT